ncbi:hypothetical protein V493_00718 [Pseudogymnoascus sp. VKM F-4281 (FW-2241)]|nr:hypothetical protein V493_00718 [Pseudogymnoascus sp. VKM F-4281 (FW-2241)]
MLQNEIRRRRERCNEGQLKTVVPRSDGKVVVIMSWYPATDFATNTREERRKTNIRPDQELPEFFTQLFDASYLYPPHGVSLSDPYLSPGVAPDDILRALPEDIIICTCEWDGLRAETERFKERLIRVLKKRVQYRMITGVFLEHPSPLSVCIDFLHPGLREHIGNLSALLPGIVEIGLPSQRDSTLDTPFRSTVRALQSALEGTIPDSQRAYAMTGPSLGVYPSAPAFQGALLSFGNLTTRRRDCGRVVCFTRCRYLEKGTNILLLLPTIGPPSHSSSYQRIESSLLIILITSPHTSTTAAIMASPENHHKSPASPPSGCVDACSSGFPTTEQPALKSAAGLLADGCCGDIGECIETAAAIECQIACEKDANNCATPSFSPPSRLDTVALRTVGQGDACDSGCCDGDVKVQEATELGGCCGREHDRDEHSGDDHSSNYYVGHNSTFHGKHHFDHLDHPYASGSSKGNKHQHEHGEDGRHMGKACSAHLRAAFDKYTSYLESARCICKSVLSTHIDTCCGKPTSTSASARMAGAAQSTAQSTSRDSLKKGSNTLSARRGMKHLNVQHGNSKSDDCHTHRFSDDCHPTLDAKAPASRGVVTQADPEKAAAREHVLLTVGGMDCSGCANKMTRSLNSMSGISNVQVVFVTGMAEFDLDSEVVAVEDVILKAERATGLRCSRVITDNQTLDVVMDADAAKQYSSKMPLGVTAFETLDKKSYRITFDPTVIGARSLLSFGDGARLAGPGQDGAWTDGRARLFKMSITTICATILTLPVVVLAWANTPVPYDTRSIISIVLATLVQALAVPEFYSKAIKSLLYNRVIEMDMLVVISISAAYGYSVVAFGLAHAGYSLETEEFFETSTLLITLVLFGRLVAAIARMKAVAAVSLRSLQVEKALLVEPSGNTVELDARLLQFGDTISIPPHSQIVTDAEILHGSSAVDESMITGESVPVSRGVGENIIAGTINGPGTLTARLTRLPGKNSITDIANLVENAYSSKPRVQDLADKVASWFIPTVTTISVIVFIIWIVVGLKLRGKNGGGAVGLAITYGIAVLAVSCPCALGLAVPMVLVVAGGVAARAGVIIKQADATERGHKVTDVVFDKTGTLTKGDLEVVLEEIMTTSLSSSKVFSIVKSLVRDNGHPVSLAVASVLQKKESPPMDLDDVQSIPGAGISANWNGSIVKAGNPYWLEIEQAPEIAQLISRGMTLLCVTLDSEILIAFGMKSNLRDEAPAVVEELRRRNIRTHIVSGDAPKVVEDVASTVSIQLENVASRQSPADKQKYVHDLMAQGKVVLFCGDGTNDAVAIAQANVGVQIGSSSDITRATADVILLSGLEGILTLIDVSKAAFRRMVFNFAWSAVYNVLAILLAAGAFVKVRIEPAYAGLGEIVSVVPVIVAALTIPKAKSFVKH